MAVAAFAVGALCAAPGFAQSRPMVRGTAAAGAGVTSTQQTQANQQMYNQGQANIQASTRANAQSQRTLSTMTQRNQQLMQSQVPKTPSATGSAGTGH